MTVSRIARGRHDAVSPQRRERVLAAMRELDYVPVRTAFQNRHSETRIIGLVVDDIYSYQGLVAPRTLDGLREAAFAADYDVLLMRSQPMSSVDEQKLQLLDRRCDGFIFVSPREREEVLGKLVEHGFPTVSCYSHDVPEGIAWVIPDNALVIRSAIHALLQKGHQKIAYIAGPQYQSSAWHRRDAYIRTMEGLGLKPLWMEMATGEASLEAARFVAENATAAICHNDHWALRLWDQFSAMGLKVPDDISLIGVDDIPKSQEQGLTTFVNPYRQIGQSAVTILLNLFQGQAVEDNCQTIPMTMVERQSVGSPRT